MKELQELNSLITRELDRDHFDDGQQLREILASAEPLYEGLLKKSLLEAGEDKPVNLSPEVMQLGSNVIRLKRRLLAYGYSTQEVSRGKH